MDEDRSFFENLYRREYEGLMQYVRRRTRWPDEAEDIVQEVFLEAYRKRMLLRSHPNVSGWLRVTAKNKKLKYEEQQLKYCMGTEKACLACPDLQVRPDGFGAAEIWFEVRKALSEEELCILRSYYAYGYTALEMAKRLGVSETCFKVRVLRIKRRLRKNLLQ